MRSDQLGDTLNDWFARVSGSGVYDSAGNPRAVLLINSGCGEPCNDASAELRRRYIDAEIVVTDRDSQGAERYGNPRTVPTLLVGRERMQGYKHRHRRLERRGLEEGVESRNDEGVESRRELGEM